MAYFYPRQLTTLSDHRTPPKNAELHGLRLTTIDLRRLSKDHPGSRTQFRSHATPEDVSGDHRAFGVAVPTMFFGVTPQLWRKYTDWPLMVAAVIFLVAYSIQVIANLPNTHADALDDIIWATWAVFAIDYIANLAMAPYRGRWFIRHLPELVVLALPVLRPLRLLRLVTLFRVMNRVAGNSLRGRVLTYVLGSAVLLTYISALAVLDAEENVPLANIRSIGDALWWAVTTVTTVGYGDYYPVTVVGRLVAVGLMIGGIAILGVVTASVASWLVEQVSEKAVAEVQAADATLLCEVARLGQRIDELTAQITPERPSGHHGSITHPMAPGMTPGVPRLVEH